jgi:hypothetical protein
MTKVQVEWSESASNTLVYKKHHGYVGYLSYNGHVFAMVIADKEIKMIPYARLTVLGPVA